ncbi:hypothetical protein NIES4103_32210 [Nostoc sp. NIES-4103]|nr:hypothetical protein NIES4103_32210 [Nostoc sp. NIES-4103]
MKNSKTQQITLIGQSNPSTVLGEFHIHIDAQRLANPFEKFLTEQQFWNSDFSGHPEGLAHCPPKKHLTKKTKNVQEFRGSFDAIVDYLQDNSEDIEGYIEAEYVPVDVEIEEIPFNPAIEIPFKLQLSSLTPGTFRQDELHITLSRAESDPRLINSLRNMGFYSVFMEKTFGEVEIFTAQGTCQMIRQILPRVITYLKTAGGAVKCSVKEERIIKWWMSSPDLILPAVIKTVEN